MGWSADFQRDDTPANDIGHVCVMSCMFVLSTHGLGFNFNFFKSFVTKGLLRRGVSISRLSRRYCLNISRRNRSDCGLTVQVRVVLFYCPENEKD